MNLKVEKSALLKYAALGTVAGSLYYVGHSFAEQKLSGGELDVETECIEQHQELLRSLIALQPYGKKYGERNFRRAVDRTDRLFFIHQQLLAKQIKPHASDRVEAYKLFKESAHLMECLMKRINADAPAEDVVHAHKHYKEQHRITEEIFESVLRMTRG